jgi:hypothetical protein
LKHGLRLSQAVLTPKSTGHAVTSLPILALAAEHTSLVAAPKLAARSQIVLFAKKSGFPSARLSKFQFASTDAKKFASRFLTLFAKLSAKKFARKFLAPRLATYVSRSHVLSTTALHEWFASHKLVPSTTAPRKWFASQKHA